MFNVPLLGKQSWRFTSSPARHWGFGRSKVLWVTNPKHICYNHFYYLYQPQLTDFLGLVTTILSTNYYHVLFHWGPWRWLPLAILSPQICSPHPSLGRSVVWNLRGLHPPTWNLKKATWKRKHTYKPPFLGGSMLAFGGIKFSKASQVTFWSSKIKVT